MVLGWPMRKSAMATPVLVYVDCPEAVLGTVALVNEKTP
jgi:hypothetical protein